MQGGRWFFVVLTVIIVAGIIYYYAKLPRTKKAWFIRIPLILIFAGAIGNFIDRFINGYVVDMFEFLFINFPVFNVADMLLVSGALSLSFILIFVVKDTKPHGWV
jgi:signal peptidase II